MAKTIFITGTSSGLGRETALLFAKRGWNVLATMRTPAQETELQTVPGIRVLELDVTKPAQITTTAAQALVLGPVDVVFNNAGYALAGPLEGSTDEQLVRQIETNLLGVMRTTRAFVSAFRERRSGMFITATSIAGMVAFPFLSAYHATKWALEGWSESLSHELAPFGVQVKTVAPGDMATDFIKRGVVMAEHPSYAAWWSKALSVYTAPARIVAMSAPEKIAEIVWEAATDYTDQLTYLAGDDAHALHAQRTAVGVDSFRAAMRAHFFGTDLP